MKFGTLRLGITEKSDIPPDAQYLQFEQRVLEDGRTLASYNIRQESTIRMRLRGRGGGIEGCTELIIRTEDGSEHKFYVNLQKKIAL